MQYFLRSTISVSLLTAFLFGGLLQAQDQEIRVKIRKQDGDQIIKIDKTFMGSPDFDIEQWLSDMGLDQFESDFQNIDVDVEIGGEDETTISIDNTDGAKKIVMIQSDDPAEVEELMKIHGGDEETIVIIGGDQENSMNQEEMQQKIMMRIESLEDELSSNEFEIISDYFIEKDDNKGTLGVMMQVDDNNTGTTITEVLPDSAAEKAGLQVGDEIVGVGETSVSSYEGLVEALAPLKKGDTVDIWYRRMIGEDLLEMVKKDVELQGAQQRMMFVGPHPPHPHPHPRMDRDFVKGERAGGCIKFEADADVNDKRGYLGVQIVDTPQGVVIDAVAEGSAASRSNMAEGMVIQTVDRQTIINSDQLIGLLKDKKPGDKVKVTYTDDTGKTWKEKLRLQSKPAAFAKAVGNCAPKDMSNCCPGQSMKHCTPAQIAQCCPEAFKNCTPAEMAKCCPELLQQCTPAQIAQCCPELLDTFMNMQDSNAEPGRKFIEIKKDQNGETTKIVIIEKDKSNNKGSATVKVIISEMDDTETKVLADSENAPRTNLKKLELDELMFFPNPSDGNVTLSFRGEENDYNIRITDLNGKEIYRGKTGKVSTYKSNIDLSDNPDGVYLLQIYSNTQILNRRIVIK